VEALCPSHQLRSTYPKPSSIRRTRGTAQYRWLTSDRALDTHPHINGISQQVAFRRVPVAQAPLANDGWAVPYRKSKRRLSTKEDTLYDLQPFPVAMVEGRGV
jgi:hypothetical protein